MGSQLATRRVSIRLAHVLVIIVIACGAFGAGVLLRPWNSSAAPGGNIEACVNRYTGAVRMSPAGVTNCSSGETKVSWVAQEKLPNLLVRSKTVEIPAGSTVFTSMPCNAGELATGGGVSTPSDSGLVIADSSPFNNGGVSPEWSAAVVNPTASDSNFTVEVICASVAP